MRLLRRRVRGELAKILLGSGPFALEPLDAPLRARCRASRFGVALRGQHGDFAVARRASRLRAPAAIQRRAEQKDDERADERRRRRRR